MVIAALKRWGAKKWVFQAEKGESTGRRHYQGSMALEARKRKTWLLSNAQVPSSGLTLSPMSSESGSFSYCTKKETRTAGPWADHPIYSGQDLLMMKNPLPWQQTMLDLLAKEPDDRTINWIWAKKGCQGKSKLVKWLKYTKQVLSICFGNATQLKTMVVAKGPFRAYVMDMPRTRGKEEAIEAIYSTIEAVKNGDVESAMYGKIQELMMMPPHVFVFANEPPNKALMSADRWDIREIVNKNLV